MSAAWTVIVKTPDPVHVPTMYPARDSDKPGGKVPEMRSTL